MDRLLAARGGSSPDLVNLADGDGDTPLHCAARGGHAGVCRRLLAAGGAPSLARPNGAGDLPEDLADEEEVKGLLRSEREGLGSRTPQKEAP